MADPEEFDRAVQSTLNSLDGPNSWRSATIAKLVASLSKAQGQMAGASKDALNPHFKSKYADLASIWDACRQPLADNQLAVLQPAKADGPHVTVTTILAHASGEWISEALTMTAGANTPQAIGSAITYGRRYGLAAMVGIAPEDDDGEGAQPARGTETAEPTATDDAMTAYKPSGLDASDLPLGVVYLTKVTPGFGKAVGFIHHSGQPPTAEGLPLYKQLEQARQWCQEGVPVRLECKQSAGSGKTYVAKIETWKPPAVTAPVKPLTSDDIAF